MLLQALFLDVAATQLTWDSSRKSLSLMDLQSSLTYTVKYILFVLCFKVTVQESMGNTW